ncbi:methyltransferase domain-containing protein [Methylobacterium organophilum]|uniref:class I SAM-dependent methyltransferase n=1 Tax=Methylobacterium organophilum TaxID=410 RepID=UPI001F130E2B|nr:methyltransferase domain-containing protein [Methylobacterium organophilum]UMY18853.1 methyltransferase domain-containing protein [Methylobacterium organophilum]
MGAASDQAAYWNGEAGARWARHQAILDAAFAPLTAALIEAASPRPGERVLDIGCGAGESALQAAARIGASGRVTAVDVSAPLLAVAAARARPAGGAPIAWIEADAARHPFGAGAFDCALSRFGVMFFEESGPAFAHLRGALAEKGRLAFLCWRGLPENPWVSVPWAAVRALLPPEARTLSSGGDEPGPFRFAASGTLPALLAEAGFRDIAERPLDRRLPLGRAADGDTAAAVAAATDFLLELGPVAGHLRAQVPEMRAEARAAIAEALHPHAVGGEAGLGAGCWLVTATR